MITPLDARLWFAVTAVVALVGLVLQVATARLDSGYFDSDASRSNVFCFATVQSNLIVMVTCAWLAFGAHFLDERLPRR